MSILDQPLLHRAVPPFYADPEVVEYGGEVALYRRWWREEFYWATYHWDITSVLRKYTEEEKRIALYGLACLGYFLRLIKQQQFSKKWDVIVARAEAQAAKEAAGEERVRALIREFFRESSMSTNKRNVAEELIKEQVDAKEVAVKKKRQRQNKAKTNGLRTARKDRTGK